MKIIFVPYYLSRQGHAYVANVRPSDLWDYAHIFYKLKDILREKFPHADISNNNRIFGIEFSDEAEEAEFLVWSNDGVEI